jgi:transposase, IS30 family
MKHYTQLTHEQRYQIHACMKAGWDQTEIATEIGAHKSTVSRELRRNRGARGYRPKQAHAVALARRAAKVSTRLSPRDWTRVERLLRLDWSPEQASGRLETENGIVVSHEWIYRYVYADKSAGGSLHRHLRCQKARRKRYGAYDRRGSLPNRVSIEDRPRIVETKRRLGDWETDTVIGHRQRGALLTAVERRSQYTLLRKLKRRTAPAVAHALCAGLARHAGKAFTVTSDNGTEFAGHETVAATLDADFFFAHAYCSWERGLNENTNGLVRQYFPKGRDLTDIEGWEIRRATHRLNHRPRKTLGYKTPHEVFFNTRTTLT